MFDTKFAELRSAVLAHAGHEETDEFPRLRESLSGEDLTKMAEDLLAAQGA